MALLQDIIAHLQQIAPETHQESYDNAGLLLGNPQTPIEGILTTLDITLPVLQEAHAKKVNLVLSHHPLLFTPLKKFQNHYTHHALQYAIRHNIAIYTAHTNLDTIPKGINHALAEQLDLQHTHFLKSDPTPTTPPRGFGILGTLPKPLTAEQFLHKVKTTFHLPCIRHAPIPPQPLQKIAIASGSSIDLLPHALAQKADAFITADIKYHQFFEAQNQLLLLDIGHYESEIITKTLLAQYVSKKFPKIALHNSTIITNPIHYYV